MLGFFARLLGCFILAAGMAVAVGDIARSLAADDVRLAAVGDIAALVSPRASSQAAGEAGSLLTERLGSIGETILTWPAAPTLGAVALVLLLLGRRRHSMARAR